MTTDARPLFNCRFLPTWHILVAISAVSSWSRMYSVPEGPVRPVAPLTRVVASTPPQPRVSVLTMMQGRRASCVERGGGVSATVAPS
jgi:hypothetical protein